MTLHKPTPSSPSQYNSRNICVHTYVHWRGARGTLCASMPFSRFLELWSLMMMNGRPNSSNASAGACILSHSSSCESKVKTKSAQPQKAKSPRIRPRGGARERNSIPGNKLATTCKIEFLPVKRKVGWAAKCRSHKTHDPWSLAG